MANRLNLANYGTRIAVVVVLRQLKLYPMGVKMRNLCFTTSLAIAYLLISVVAVSAQDPIHQWSFSETAGAAPDGTVFVDSIGGADGVVRGVGASFTGGSLSLPGGSPATQAYGDLPNGLVGTAGPSLSDATFEGWYTGRGSHNWSRIFDFGSSEGAPAANNEVTGPGNTNGAGDIGWDYLFLAHQRGGNILDKRTETRNEDPNGPGVTGGGATGDWSVPGYVLNQEYHFTVTVDSDDAGTSTITTYHDGVQVNQFNSAAELSEINDVNNWLGRSNWTGDQNFQGDFNEFRIYDEALDAQQVADSFAAGPDVNFAAIPEPVSFAIWVIVGLLGGIGWYRLRKRP